MQRGGTFHSLLLLLFSFALALPSVAQVVIATLPVGQNPGAVAVNSITNKTYVVDPCGDGYDCAQNGTVTVIDGATLSTQTVNIGFASSAEYSGDVAINPVTNKIYVTNDCGNDRHCASTTVTVIDGATLSTQTVTVGSRGGWGFGASRLAVNWVTNKIYATNSEDNTVTVIDGATNSTTTLNVVGKPSAVALNSVTNKIYATLFDRQTLAIIDGATNGITFVTVGWDAGALAVNSVTNKIYVLNDCGDSEACGPPTVTVIDGATLVTQTISVGTLASAGDFSALAINSVTNKIYVVSTDWCNYCYSGAIVVIDGATLATQAVAVNLQPDTVDIDSVTNKIYVLSFCRREPGCPGGGSVTAIDGATLSTTAVSVGNWATHQAVDPTTHRIYVSNTWDNTVSVIAGDTTLQFVPVMPCRLVDTRDTGGPIPTETSRDFAIPQLGGCNIPATATAYSLNLTAMPYGPLGYLAVYPTGNYRPYVSTLNSTDGRVKANAVIMPAGVSGSVSVWVTYTTDIALDINGYFTFASDSTLAFYPLTPCRVVDTREGQFLPGGQEADFAVSGACNTPDGAAAYSLNLTVVPRQPLGSLMVWPAGQSQPSVSTLYSPTGDVVANAAMVQAGQNGKVAVYPSSDTDLIIDIDGYYAPASSAPGGLSLYTLMPCRPLDTRLSSGMFWGTLRVNVVDNADCLPGPAQALVLNATVVPYFDLGYLALWPDGQPQPLFSNLNTQQGSVASNMAIVATDNGWIDAYATQSTHLILDILSYFAP